MIFKAFKEANRWIFPVWYDRWILWLVVFAGVEFINQLMIHLLDGFEASQVAYLFNGLLSSALDFALALMVPPVLVSLKKSERVNLARHLKKFFNQAAIESVRSTARVCWYSYLFLVPGFIKLLRLQLVPYIVQFDQAYDQGKKDALKGSEKLSQGHLIRFFVIFIICALLGMLENIRGSFNWNTTYFALAFILTLPIRLYTQITWFSVYDQLTNSKEQI